MSRVGEFVRYHNGFDGECNGVLLSAWADRRGLSSEDRFDLAYMYSVVYNVPSAIYLFDNRAGILEDVDGWVSANKDRLLFQSDRRWMRIGDRLNRCLEQFRSNLTGGGEFLQLTVQDGIIDASEAIRIALGWYYFSRFGAYLFAETLAHTLGVEQANNPKFDWENGDTATSGALNLMGMPSEADEFDAGKGIPKNVSLAQLDAFLATIADAVESAGGDSSVSCLETSLCAYRKFVKGSRYNGYYIDRQLGELVSYPEINPNASTYINELYELRAEIFPSGYLGEMHNWLGVRRKMKKYFQRYGRINWPAE